MAVTLRLTRMGRKKRPFYRIVAADSRAPRDGKYLEKIGTYDPLSEPPEIHIDKELALKWLQQGAKPSVTVRNFLSDFGIMFEYDLRKRGLSTDEIETEYKKWEVMQLERKKKEEALAAMKKREEEKTAEKEAKAKAKEEETAEKAAAEAEEAVVEGEAEETTEPEATAEPEKPAEETETAVPAETEEPAEEKKTAASAEPEEPEEETKPAESEAEPEEEKPAE